MKTKFVIAAVCAAVLLTGCGGTVYSNCRDVGELSVIRVMGFDGELLTVSADDGAVLSAECASVSATTDKLQDLSPKEELFFSHSSYVLVGETAAGEGIGRYLDFIGRSWRLRPDIPVFAVLGGDASELITASENAADALSSLEKNLEKRGSPQIFSAGELIAHLNSDGAALVCAVKREDNGENTAVVPAGYGILRDGRLVGSLDPEAAMGADLLRDRTGPATVTLGSGAVQLLKTDCEIRPVTENGRVRSLEISLSVAAALSEPVGGDAEKELSDELGKRMASALDESIRLGCDFMHLNDAVRLSAPLRFRTLTLDMSGLTYSINVSAEISRSFDLEKPEVRE